MAYEPGKNFLETLETLNTERSRGRAQAFSEAMGVSQEKRAWEQLQANVGMFKATEKRLESNAIINAMLSLYGIQKEDDWEKLRAESRAEIMNILPWIQLGAQLNTTMNEANLKGLGPKEGGSPIGAAMIEIAKQFISSEPPDRIYANGITAADSSMAMIDRLNTMPQSPNGKKKEFILINDRGNYKMVEKPIRATTNILATTNEGQSILDDIIQNTLKAGLAKERFHLLGTRETEQYPSKIQIDSEGGVPSVLLFQDVISNILGKLPADEYGEVKDENGNVYLTGSPVKDATVVAEQWLHPKGNKNNLIVQSVQQILAKKGIQIEDIAVFTPSQHEAVKLLADYRDHQYNLYTRLPAQDRANKYGIVNYLQSQTESAQNLYKYIEQEQETSSKKMNIPRGNPPIPPKLPKQDSVEYESEKEQLANYMRPAYERVLAAMADRAKKGSTLDKAILDEINLMLAEVYLQKAKNNKDGAHKEAVELLDYINTKIETDDEYAYYPESIAPSEAMNLYFLLTLPTDSGGFGLTFASGETKLWRFLEKK